MQLAILALLIVASASASQPASKWEEYSQMWPFSSVPSQNHADFEPNQRTDKLVYSYESEVLSGIEGVSLKYGGLKVIADLEVERSQSDSDSILFQLTNPSIWRSTDQDMPSPGLNQPLPRTKFAELNNKDIDELKRQLEMPFKVKMTIQNGIRQFQKLLVSRDMPMWCLNLKRAIVVAWQVPSVNQQGRNTNQVESQMMRDLYGECESTLSYQVLDQANKTSSITNVRNFRNCTNAPVILDFSTNGMTRCNQRKNDSVVCQRRIVPNQVTEYKVRQIDSSNQNQVPEILSLTQRSVHYLPEFNYMADIHATPTVYTVQQMHLSNKQSSQSIDDKDLTKQVEIEKESDNMDLFNGNHIRSQSENPMSREDSKNCQTQIKAAVMQYHETVVASADEKVSQAMERLVYQIRQCAEISVLEAMISDESLPIEHRRTLFDLMPTCAKPECVMTALKMLENNKLESTLVKQMFIVNSIALNAHPDTKVINEIMRILTQRRRQLKTSLSRSLTLAAGTLINRFARQQTNLGNERTQVHNSEYMNHIVENLFSLLKTLPSVEQERAQAQKTIYKALANAVLDNEMLIEKVFQQLYQLQKSEKSFKNEEIEVFVEIARTLRGSILMSRNKVQYEQQLLDLYLTLRSPVHDKVRMAVFETLIENHCELSTLETIVNSLRTEEDLHLQSFVYSYLRTIESRESPSPIYASFVQRVRTALRTFQAPIISAQNSYVTGFWQLNQKSKNGMYNHIMYTRGKLARNLPERLVWRNMFTTQNIFTPFMEISLTSNGIVEMGETLLGKENVEAITKMLQSDENVPEIIANYIQKGEFVIPEKYNTIFNQENMKNLYESAVKNGNAELSWKLFDFELFFMDSQTLREMMLDAMVKMVSSTENQSRRQQGSAYGKKLFDITENIVEMLESEFSVKFMSTWASMSMTKVPTSVGVASMWNSTMGFVAHAKGSFQITTDPSLKECMSKMELPRKVSITATNLNRKAIMIARQKLLVAIPHIQSGYIHEFSSSVQLPFSGKVEFERVGNNFELRGEIEPKKVPSMDFQMKPVWFLRTQWSDQQDTERTTLMISPTTTNLVQIERIFGCEAINKKVAVHYESCVQITPISATPLFACKNAAKIQLFDQSNEDSLFFKIALSHEELGVEIPRQSGQYKQTRKLAKNTKSRMTLKIFQRRTTSIIVLSETEAELIRYPEQRSMKFDLSVGLPQSNMNYLIKYHLTPYTKCDAFPQLCPDNNFASFSVSNDQETLFVSEMKVDTPKTVTGMLGAKNDQCFTENTAFLKELFPEAARINTRINPEVISKMSQETVDALYNFYGQLTNKLFTSDLVTFGWRRAYEENLIIIYLKPCPTLGKLDMIVERGEQRIMVSNWPVFTFLTPNVLPAILPRGIVQNIDESVCVKTSRSVQTFDGHTYQTLEKNECGTVLAKDCGKNPKWQIISKSMNDDTQLVKIQFGNKQEIQMIPSQVPISRQQLEAAPELKLNGQTQELSLGSSIKLGNSYNTLFVCHKHASTLECESSQLGFKLATDGYQVRIAANNLKLGGLLCGQCGNNDNNKEDEAINQISHILKNPNDQDCQYESSPVRSECVPEQKVAEVRNKGETCLSVRKLAVCPSGCKASANITPKPLVNFVCVQEKNVEKFRSLIQQDRLHDERLLQEITDVIVQEVPIPESCIDN